MSQKTRRRIPVKVAAAKGACNACAGADHCGCCHPVMLGMTQAQAAMDPTIDPANRRWIVEDLTPMRFKDGLALRPDLAARVAAGHFLLPNVDGKPPAERDVMAVTVFYRCRHYDIDARRCTDYENRPGICRGYPWYGRPPRPGSTLPPACGYQVDVPPA